MKQIAESDEVRSALTAQSMGLADEVADQLRARTMAADDVLERFARRWSGGGAVNSACPTTPRGRTTPGS